MLIIPTNSQLGFSFGLQMQVQPTNKEGHLEKLSAYLTAMKNQTFCMPQFFLELFHVLCSACENFSEFTPPCFLKFSLRNKASPKKFIRIFQSLFNAFHNALFGQHKLCTIEYLSSNAVKNAKKYSSQECGKHF